MITIKRIYEPAARNDGYRVLVDRLWPRGMKKTEVKLDEWLKELAPSDTLRKKFSHDPERFAEFKNAYRLELRSKQARAQILALARQAARQRVTLLYSARDEKHNNAVVLKEVIERAMRPSAAGRKQAA